MMKLCDDGINRDDGTPTPYPHPTVKPISALILASEVSGLCESAGVVAVLDAVRVHAKYYLGMYESGRVTMDADRAEDLRWVLDQLRFLP